MTGAFLFKSDLQAGCSEILKMICKEVFGDVLSVLFYMATTDYAHFRYRLGVALLSIMRGRAFLRYRLCVGLLPIMR